MWVCCVLRDRPVHAGAKGKSAGHNVDLVDVPVDLADAVFKVN